MKISIFPLFLLLALTLMPESAQAQVSVRRGNSRTESSAPKKEKKEKEKKEKPARHENPMEQAGRGPVIGQNSGEGEPNRMSQPSVSAPTSPTPAKRTTTPKKTGVQKSEAVLDGMTLRQQAFSEYQKNDGGHVTWQHVVYRELDLTKEQNASLYYPQEPQDGLTNLFRVIFEGICTNRIKGYEYMDGREIFTDKYVVKVRDVLDKFSIYYKETPGAGRDALPVYEVDEMDVPSNEVLKYYVKERWEFDQRTSKYGPRILALCPILLRSGDFGGDAVPYPMFWVNYEDLRPLLREHLVMSDGLNNTPRYTMEEYFALNQYDGEIYKVQNTRGMSLMQQFPDSASLDSARTSIEAQLRGFKDSIWVHQMTPEEEAAQEEEAASRRAAKRAAAKEEKAAGRTAAREAKQADKDAKRNRRTGEVVDMEAVEAEREAKEDEIDQRIEETGTAHSARRSARRH